jgi:ASC-1-like (ASCH) protein
MIELAFEDAHFQDIKNGKKTVIGKIDVDLQGIKKGDTVIFFKDVGKNSSEKISVKVKDIKKFKDIPTMLKEMKLKSILPRSKSYKDGEKVFEETYGNRLKDAKFTAFTFEIVENKEPNGPRVKNKKNSEPNGPRVKNKKNGEPNGPNVKNKKNNMPNEVEVENEEEDENEIENEEENSNEVPSVKRKKNGDNSSNGPSVKRKKNGVSNEGPRVKNKKNGNSNEGPRVKNKKNGNRPPREFEVTIREPWLSLIENGQKQVEARLFKGVFTEFKVNDTIRFINNHNGKEKSVTVKITKLTKYPNFRELLFHEKFYRVLPGYPDVKCGNILYERIYKFNEIKEFGALAIEVGLT